MNSHQLKVLKDFTKADKEQPFYFPTMKPLYRYDLLFIWYERWNRQ